MGYKVALNFKTAWTGLKFLLLSLTSWAMGLWVVCHCIPWKDFFLLSFSVGFFYFERVPCNPGCVPEADLKFFLNLLDTFLLCLWVFCLHVCVYAMGMPGAQWRSEEGVRSFGTVVMNGCEPLGGCWELNLDICRSSKCSYLPSPVCSPWPCTFDPSLYIATMITNMHHAKLESPPPWNKQQSQDHLQEWFLGEWIRSQSLFWRVLRFEMELYRQ